MSPRTQSESTPLEEAPVRAEERPAGAKPGLGALGLLVLLVGSFITVLDYFIANVAVPSIAADLDAGQAASQLVIIGYGVSFTAGLILGGRLGDVHGRRRVFLVGMLVFGIASLACAVAPDIATLTAARLVQGVGAALLVPQVLGIVNAGTEGAARVRAYTIYGLVVGLAGVFGQFIGGALISWGDGGLGWRLIFLINVPVCALAMFVATRSLPADDGDRGQQVDYGTAFLAGAGLGLVLAFITLGREHGWPWWGWVMLVAGVGLLVEARVVTRSRQSRGEDTLVPAGALAGGAFRLGVLALVAYFVAMGAFFFVLSLYLQNGLGLSAWTSGVIFLAVGGGYFLSAMVSMRLLPSHPGLVVLGPCVLATGLVLAAGAAWFGEPEASLLVLLPGLVTAGAGMGMTTGPLTSLAMATAPDRAAAVAAGLVNTAQEGGAALGVGLSGLIFFPLLNGSASAADQHGVAFTATLAGLMVACLLASLLARRASRNPNQEV